MEIWWKKSSQLFQTPNLPKSINSKHPHTPNFYTLNFHTGYRRLCVKITVRAPLPLPNPREKPDDPPSWRVFYFESCCPHLWKLHVKCMNRKVYNDFNCKTVTHNTLILPCYCIHSSSRVSVQQSLMCATYQGRFHTIQQQLTNNSFHNTKKILLYLIKIKYYHVPPINKYKYQPFFQTIVKITDARPISSVDEVKFRKCVLTNSGIGP